MMRRRMSTIVGMAALVTGGLLAFAAPASASEHGGTQALWVTVTGDGSKATISNDDLQPGWLTLHVKDRTTASSGAQVVVVKMRPGFSVSRLVADIDVQINQNSTPAQGAASTRDINKIAVAYGGGGLVRQIDVLRLEHALAARGWQLLHTQHRREERRRCGRRHRGTRRGPR